ncbi:MAG: ATP-binding cassette domain-containing protein [Chitinophagaceae bacterium]|nr:ATP-binding cassette domain-containing protein [Chitinophagaceae bacterium]MCW5926947.1 ATP-binding cassette domain-containing protein [Chitinophagaceae bacterium]
MASFYLLLRDVGVTLNGKRILDNLSLTINRHECWVVTGPSGSGKTTLANTIAGRHFFSGHLEWDYPGRPRVLVVEQQHRFKNLSNISDFYYQQRFNASDAEDAITVREALNIGNYPSVLSSGIRSADVASIVSIDTLLEEPLIQLSNGENKRLQIAKAILEEPDMMILDSPFTGLDVAGREMLNKVTGLLKRSGMPLMIITAANEIPADATHIAILDDGRLKAAMPLADYRPSMVAAGSYRLDMALLQSLRQENRYDFEYAVRMVNVNVAYGDRQILNHINWQVKKGEHWAISGPNGAGKSTLLSLLTGDNTMAYSNEIYLFDKRRGTGESIWDIKKRIGYVSPEMHLYFDYSATSFETVASGLFDSIGLFRKLSEEQTDLVMRWLRLFRLETTAGKRLASLSMGEQRLVLLARALVKEPPLLILDEPCQGLDKEHVEQFTRLIDDVCSQFDTTLLYVSHYKNEIPRCVTRFMMLKNGAAEIT